MSSGNDSTSAEASSAGHAALLVDVTAFGQRYRADLSRAHDACFPVLFTREDVRAFSLPRASAKPIELGSFVGDVERGGSVNCEQLVLHPHGNGTHTECVGHVLATPRMAGGATVLDVTPRGLVPALVVVVKPTVLGQSSERYGGKHAADDCVVTRAGLEAALALTAPEVTLQNAALVVRAGLSGGDLSGTNPPYFTTDAMDLIVERGVSHLLTDLPSLDREDDGGALSSHRRLWSLAPGAVHVHDAASGDDTAARRRTVTETCRLEGVEGGRYLLSLQVAPLESDAAPSRPLLFPLEAAGEAS